MRYVTKDPQRFSLRSIAANIGLMLGTLAALLLVFEHVVFRYILPTSDVLPNASLNSVVRYVPGTTAKFYGPDGHVSTVNVNADGWNSTKFSYALAKPKGRLRIAVIGDSYVQARQVDTDKAFPAIIEQQLRARGIDAEVLRFGIDGAPLSQYLHMLREEVRRYRPDVIVVQLIHNDFDESYRFLKGRYTSSFMKVVPLGDGVFRHVKPEDFRPSIADALRDLRIFRYFYYQTGLMTQLKSVVNKYFWGGQEFLGSADTVSSAVDIRAITETHKIRQVTGHIFDEFKAVAAEEGAALILSMDGVREAVYAKRHRSLYEVGRLNQIAETLAQNRDLTFVDLGSVFREHFLEFGQRFEFSWDWHWNRLGHQLVGATLAQKIIMKVGPEQRAIQRDALKPRTPRSAGG